MKTSEEMGGRVATRRLRLYRLQTKKKQGQTGSATNSGTSSGGFQDLLPVVPHVALLQVAVAEGYLAGIAGVWMSRRYVLRRRSATAAGNGRHDCMTLIVCGCVF